MNNSNIRENPNGDQRAYYATKNFALSGKIMMSAIIILFTVVLLILCLHIYARWFLLRSRRNQRRRGTNFVFSGENGQNPTTNTANAQQGLEISILRSLPIFVFTTNSHKDGLECAVCLCEIEENEKLRVLPKCNHSFHLGCIDMWFHSHSTCPLCRSAVTPDVPAPVTQENLNPDLGQIPVEEDLEASLSHAGICSSCRHAEESSSSSSSGVRGSSSEEEGSSSSQKGISITVELPRRTESFRAPGDDPAISPGLKSSGSRMLSLKRILSRDRRASLGISFSFSSETDLEQGGAEHR